MAILECVSKYKRKLKRDLREARHVLLTYRRARFANLPGVAAEIENKHLRYGAKLYRKNALLRSDSNENRCLIVDCGMDYVGGNIACFYMALALRRMGCLPVALSPKDGPLVDSYIKENIPVIIMPHMTRIGFPRRLSGLFRFVVVNTAQNVQNAMQAASTGVPVLWWVHESLYSYTQRLRRHLPERLPENIFLYAVGLAADNIKSLRPMYSPEPLNCCISDIPDTPIEELRTRNSRAGKTVFGCAGTIHPLKGQNILSEAIALLTEEERKDALFLFAGGNGSRAAFDGLSAFERKYPETVEYVGLLDRRQMRSFYAAIDCVICASREETMSMAVAEGLQAGKQAICSENAGIARLMRARGVGRTFPVGDAAALAERIREVLRGNADAREQAARGYKLYAEELSEDAFFANVQKILPTILK